VQRANKARGFIGEDVRGGIGGLYPLRCGWMMKMEAEALRRATGFGGRLDSTKGMYLEL
jgi:hypothetical protein